MSTTRFYELLPPLQASTEYERDSTSPGSIASSIDWEEIDKILEN